MLITQRQFTLHIINVNFPKVRVTYIKFTQNFRKQCVPNFILCEFAAAQTTQQKLMVTMQWEDEQAMEIFKKKD